MLDSIPGKLLQTINILRKAGAALLLPILYLLLAAILTSCQKEKISFTFTELPSGTTYDLNNLFFLDDSTGYVCGGSRYDKGEILKTTNGGFSWKNQSTAEMSKALYRIVFSSPDTGFACGYDGMIFRTFDQGNHWEYFQSSLFPSAQGFVHAEFSKGFGCGGNGFQSGYMLSTSDAGNSWQPDTSKLEYRSIFFFNDSIGVIAGYGAIQRTTDGGETWTYTNAEQDFFVSMSFVNDEVGYTVGYTGSIMKTTDGGKSWDRQRNSNSLFEPPLYFNRVIFRDENVGYIIGEHGCLMKTKDGGNHWMKVKNAPDVDWKGIALVKNGGFLCGTGGKTFIVFSSKTFALPKQSWLVIRI